MRRRVLPGKGTLSCSKKGSNANRPQPQADQNQEEKHHDDTFVPLVDPNDTEQRQLYTHMLDARYEFTTKTNTLDAIPVKDEKEWELLQQELMMKVIQNSQQLPRDLNQARELFVEWMTAPKKHLSRKRSHRATHDNHQLDSINGLQHSSGTAQQDMCDDMDDPMSLEAMPKVCEVEEHIEDDTPAMNAVEAEDVIIKNVKRTVRKGGSACIKRAIKMLQRNALRMVGMGPLVFNKLKAMHPKRSEAEQDTLNYRLPLSRCDTNISVSVEELRSIIESCNNGAAPGPSGWRANYLTPLVHNEIIMQGLSIMLRDVINANVYTTTLTKQLLLGSTLIAVDKNENKQPVHNNNSNSSSSSSPQQALSVRPITMNELLYKMAAKYVMNQITAESLKRIFPHIQYGVNVRGGSDRAFQLINALLFSGCYSNELLGILQTDIANAFNTVSRKAIFDQLRQYPNELSPMYRLFQYTYAEGTPLLVYYSGSDTRLYGTLTSDTGVRQGDVMAAFAFALAVQPVYEKLLKLMPNVRGVGLMDDFNIVGDPAELLQCVPILEKELAGINLVLQKQKCNLLVHTDITQRAQHMLTLIDQCKEIDIQLRHDRLKILGGCVSFLPKCIADYVTETASSEKLQTFLARLSHDLMEAQLAHTLLRFSGVARMNYIARVTHPDQAVKGLDEFDCRVRDTFCNCMGIAVEEMSETQHDQLRMKLKYGGAGLRSSLMTSAAAYLSSLLQIVDDVKAAYFPNTELGLSYIGRQRDAVVNALQKEGRMTKAVRLKYHLCQAIASTSSKTYQQLQHNLQLEMDDWAYKALKKRLAEKDIRSYNRIECCARENANRWLTVNPAVPAYNIDTRHYCMAIRLLLGLPPAHWLLQHRCGCKYAQSFSDQPTHLLACKRFAWDQAIRRHNSTAQVLGGFVKKQVPQDVLYEQRCMADILQRQRDQQQQRGRSQKQQHHQSEAERVLQGVAVDTGGDGESVLDNDGEMVERERRDRTDVVFTLERVYAVDVSIVHIDGSISNVIEPHTVIVKKKPENRTQQRAATSSSAAAAAATTSASSSGKKRTHSTSQTQCVHVTNVKSIVTRESQKHRHYTSACQAIGQFFSPFVLETHGSYGYHARQLLERIKEHCAELERLERSFMLGLSSEQSGGTRHITAFAHLLNSLSVQLHRDNAHKLILATASFQQYLHSAQALQRAPAPQQSQEQINTQRTQAHMSDEAGAATEDEDDSEYHIADEHATGLSQMECRARDVQCKARSRKRSIRVYHQQANKRANTTNNYHQVPYKY